MHNQGIERNEKRAYVAPRLINHGTVEEITASQNKKFGTNDGFLFMGIAITNAS